MKHYRCFKCKRVVEAERVPLVCIHCGGNCFSLVVRG
jgi:DNA-directed RNA polymerase subunit RPC12/RpoP